MFNKRDHESDSSDRSREIGAAQSSRGGMSAGGSGASGATAIIGPSISINGELKGQEDLVVEGTIEGTVELKQNTLTVGSKGTIKAQVYAHTILVDGTVNGDLYASERISIRKSARIEGNILAPRISLEDGAKFRGSIDMDAESEAFRKVFNDKSTGPAVPGPKSPTTDAGARSAAERSSPGESEKGPSGKTASSAV